MCQKSAMICARKRRELRGGVVVTLFHMPYLEWLSVAVTGNSGKPIIPLVKLVFRMFPPADKIFLRRDRF